MWPTLAPINDDYVGGSDQAPFERLGLPTATLVGNFDRYMYMGYPTRPWSYPNDTPRDTIALLERIAAGVPRPSPALATALALPGQITVEMLHALTRAMQGHGRCGSCQVVPATTASGMPAAPVNRLRLVPFLPRSVGVAPVAAPPKGALVMTPSAAGPSQSRPINYQKIRSAGRV